MSEFVSYNAFNKTSMHVIRQVIDLQRAIDHLQSHGLSQEDVDKLAKEVQKFDGLIEAYKQGMLDVATLPECRRVITDRNVDRKVLSDLRKIKSLEIVY